MKTVDRSLSVAAAVLAMTAALVLIIEPPGPRTVMHEVAAPAADVRAGADEGIVWGLGALLLTAGVAWAAFRFGASRRDRAIDAVLGEARALREDINRYLDRLH